MLEVARANPLRALVEEAWRHARRRRVVIAALVAGGAAAIGLFVLLGEGGGPTTPAQSGRFVTDGILRIIAPRRWYSSVAFAAYGPTRAAYILVGNFPLGRDAAQHVAAADYSPTVPTSRVLITISDFPRAPRPLGYSLVQRLRLPRPAGEKRQVSWNVFYRRRFLALSVMFGSRPTPGMGRLVDGRLASVRRIGPDLLARR